MSHEGFAWPASLVWSLDHKPDHRYTVVWFIVSPSSIISSQITVRDDIPANAQQNDIGLEMTPLKGVLGNSW